MEQGELFDANSVRVQGWGFLRATIQKYGLQPDTFEGFWESMIAQDYEFKQMTLANLDRKWEVVSAYQKSVRRGDALFAKRVASALLNTKDCEMIRYLWRRACTTAAEDIGLANPTMVAFTLLCAETFTPSKFMNLQKPVLYWLTDQLANGLKDRSLCSMAVIDAHYVRSDNQSDIYSKLGEDERVYVTAVRECKDYPPEDEITSYLAGQNWRTEEMGKFYPVGQVLQGGEWYEETPPMLDAPVICGLPCYAYDMHTQVGKQVLAIMTGYTGPKDFFKEYAVKDKIRALGWPMFYLEGGLLNRHLEYAGRQELFQTEVKVALLDQGIPAESHERLFDVVRELLTTGVINERRQAAAKVRYAK